MAGAGVAVGAGVGVTEGDGSATGEGVELNVLGLTFGFDPLDLALNLPLAGKVNATRWIVPALALLLLTTVLRRRLKPAAAASSHGD